MRKTFVRPVPSHLWMLDNIGMTVALSSLGVWSEYKEAGDKLFGRGFFLQAWKRYVFPILFPGEYSNRVRRYESLEKVLQREFIDAVIKAKMEHGLYDLQFPGCCSTENPQDEAG